MYKIITKLLTPNKYSRPQKILKKVEAIVIHWVANPNSTALANRNFFENRKSGNSGYGSAQEFIDLNGDVLVCIPDNEISYNCGSDTYTERTKKELGSSPNSCTYGIECTHIDWNGKMTNETYNTLVQRCSDLCKKWNLNPLTDLWTHKEVVGWKDCHKWFVDHPDEWKAFKQKVYNKINLPKPVTPPPQPKRELNFNESISLFQSVKPKIISDASYWLEHCQENGRVKNEYAIAVIMRATKTSSLVDGVNVLVGKEITKSPNYWLKLETVEDIDGLNMQKLIVAMANKLKF